ncbi:TY-Chap2 family putative peptide chaperone [Actinoplanes sp. RD1]|uniref:TY-Chap2 family putative peptide chaperone n=1 Tax=Actinoplanes sp. RD1 TaxID=3064538 RepID=UPI002740DCF3|nr:hypothetical protein [Actinoplanes sp. RD1]
MQSWWLAALLIRRHPELTCIETHPGDGMYDCLSLFRDGDKLIDINREGSVHVHRESRWTPVPVEALLDIHDVTAFVHDLEEAAGLRSPAHAPASTPAVLAYRVIAQIMAITVNAKETWDVRNVLLDASGMGGGVKEEYLTPFPVAAERARQVRADDLLGIPYYRYWCVLRAGKPVAILDTDGFVYAGQQVIALPEVYAAHSRRLMPTVATALGVVLP